MRVTIEPFAERHIEPAAALLAARHQRDRVFEPRLPAAFEEPSATLTAVQELVADSTFDGVVALQDGQVVAYLGGSLSHRPPTNPFAATMQPRAGTIGYTGAASIEEGAARVYHQLYGTLAAGWVRRGVIRHYITIPTHDGPLDLWADLGFGRYIALAVRSTDPLTERDMGTSMRLDVRRATVEDESVVQELVTGLFRAFSDPPILVPYLPETTAERHAFVSEYLADPGCPVWLASIDNRVVGVQVFEEPHSPQWDQHPLTTPPNSVYLLFAFTSPDVRGTGVGAAFFDQTMAWAQGAGYDSCLLHYFTASRAAAFWRRLGFLPIAHVVSRSIDERVIWADGKG